MWNETPPDFSNFQREFIVKCPALAFLFRPDLAQIAFDSNAEQSADFERFHGSDLALFPDGLSMVAAEQNRVRTFGEKKAGPSLKKILKKHGLARLGQCDYPPDIVECKRDVAIFCNKEDGVEIFINANLLFSALKKAGENLSEEEMSSLQEFVESDILSPAFVRRIIRTTGSAAIEKLYFLPNGTSGIDYLLRRFKGRHYRKHYPSISVLE